MGVKRLALALALSLWACDAVPPTGPIPPDPPPAPQPPVDPPSASRGVQFSWDNTRGILWFPGTQASEGQIKAAHDLAKSVGYPTITWHVCTEVVEWEGTGLLDPPWAAADGVENLAALRRFLRTTAQLGDQVLLDIFCTVRDNHWWMVSNWLIYTREIGRIAADYDHIAIHIANEPWHPRSWFRDKPNALKAARNELLSIGFTGPIGADDNIGCAGCSFDYQYRWADWTDFHPYRNPNPTRKALRRMVEVNTPPVVISEPTAYGRDGGCCTSNFAEIMRYICDGEAEGIVMFYHSREGLEGLEFTTLPGRC